ncbi:hypothetical protein MHYP_G00267430 [Metynnis hypsauchen]
MIPTFSSTVHSGHRSPALVSEVNGLPMRESGRRRSVWQRFPLCTFEWKCAPIVMPLSASPPVCVCVCVYAAVCAVMILVRFVRADMASGHTPALARWRVQVNPQELPGRQKLDFALALGTRLLCASHALRRPLRLKPKPPEAGVSVSVSWCAYVWG